MNNLPLWCHLERKGLADRVHTVYELSWNRSVCWPLEPNEPPISLRKYPLFTLSWGLGFQTHRSPLWFLTICQLTNHVQENFHQFNVLTWCHCMWCTFTGCAQLDLAQICGVDMAVLSWCLVISFSVFTSDLLYLWGHFISSDYFAYWHGLACLKQE